MEPQVTRDPGDFQRRMLELKRAGQSICVVPTMGALHGGHRALVAEGRGRADVLVVTVFVNPAQFAPGEDFDTYPRSFEADLEMCRSERVDHVFVPTDETMYASNHATYVSVDGLEKKLCGVSRPLFFRGVATVVTKLFLITQADVAVFGWKDAQQQIVIRRMVRDLNIPIEIAGVETVREVDGLAMSSRNKYLSPQERAETATLSRALFEARRRVEEEGELDGGRLRREIVQRIEAETSARLDYVGVVSMDTLDPLETVERGGTLIALAAYWGATRLIDNVRV